jgi:hypothetical protein
VRDQVSCGSAPGVAEPADYVLVADVRADAEGRGHHELGLDSEPGRQLEASFTELALVI